MGPGQPFASAYTTDLGTFRIFALLSFVQLVFRAFEYVCLCAC